MFFAALASVVIASCYDGDICTTTISEGIDIPEHGGKGAEPVPAIVACDYLRDLVVGKKVEIRGITEDRYGHTVAKLSLGTTDVQQELVGNRQVISDGFSPFLRVSSYRKWLICSSTAHITQSRSPSSPFMCQGWQCLEF